MCVAAVLQWLGPPSDRTSRDDGGSAARQSARPVGPEPVAATPAQPRPGRDEQVAAQSEARSSVPVPPPAIAAPPASPTDAPPTSPDPRVSEREDTRQAVVILYAPRSQAAQAAAEQLAPLVGLAPGQVETRAAADIPSRAVIRFYESGDHALARRIGHELSRMGYSWRIENRSDRPPSEHQVPEIWLPDR